MTKPPTHHTPANQAYPISTKGAYMQLIPHLTFNGDCEAAFRLYEQCLDGHITLLLTYAESPAPNTPSGFENKILHATLKIGDQTITGVDHPAATYQKPQGFALQLNLTDPAQAQRIFDTLQQGGTTTLPLQPVFWSQLYGLVTDRFGTPWEINCA
jgi:PhnB protein